MPVENRATDWIDIEISGTHTNTWQTDVLTGTTWYQRYSRSISMVNCIQAGIFTESVRSNQTSIAYFDNVEVLDYLKTGDETAKFEFIEMDTGTTAVIV